MNAPETIPSAAYELVLLTNIELSQTPMQKLRRKRFDKDAMKELTISVREHGVLQPVLVRPVGSGYELVAGERRYLASKAATTGQIPAIVRTLTDLQVIEMQVIENNQREDLHPLIEAEGYDLLRKIHKLTADDIAAKIGRSRSHVYGVLKYADLCPEARRAFFDGKLTPSTALLIARIGHHDTQRAAMKDVIEGEPGYARRRGGDPMSYREAHQHILRNYMLKLKAAPFDINDAALVPKAGTCQACPKRTGNQRDLFGDVKDADVCTDPKCYDDKRQAHYAIDRRKLEAAGHKVISGAAARKAMPLWENGDDYLAGGFVKMDDTTYAGGMRPRKIAELLGEDYKPTLIQHPGTGKIIKVATQQAVAAASQKSGKGGSSARSTVAMKAKPKGPDVDDQEMERLVKLIHEKAPKEFGKPQLLAIARQVVQDYGPRRNGLEAVAKAWGWGPKAFSGDWSRKLPNEAVKLGIRDLQLLMLEVMFASFWGSDARKRFLDLFGISEAKTRELIIKERRDAAAAARAAKKPKVKAPAKGKK